MGAGGAAVAGAVAGRWRKARSAAGSEPRSWSAAVADVGVASGAVVVVVAVVAAGLVEGTVTKPAGFDGEWSSSSTGSIAGGGSGTTSAAATTRPTAGTATISRAARIGSGRILP